MTIVPSLEFALDAKGNTTTINCCISGNGAVNNSNTTTNNNPSTEDDTDVKMIFDGVGLSPESIKTASLICSCLNRLNCFADLKLGREVRDNLKAREMFETLITQKLGIDLAHSLLTENGWNKNSRDPLTKKDALDLKEKAENLQVSVLHSLQEAQHAAIFKEHQKLLNSPAKEPFPLQEGKTGHAVPLSEYMSISAHRSLKPLTIDKPNKQLRELFNPEKVADCVQRVSEADKDQAMAIARQVHSLFASASKKQTIDSKLILSSLAYLLKENSIPMKIPRDTGSSSPSSRASTPIPETVFNLEITTDAEEK